MCVAGGYCDRCLMLAFCAFCLSWVPPVGLIWPDLQQFKRKLHKNAPRRGTGAAVWLWLLALSAGLALIDLPIAAAALPAFQRAGAGPVL